MTGKSLIGGHHIVRTFACMAGETKLPEGWKPFAYDHVTDSVIARKWVRGESNGS